MTTRTTETKSTAKHKVTFQDELAAVTEYIKASSCAPHLGGFRLGFPESRSKFLLLEDEGDGRTVARTTDIDDIMRPNALRSWHWIRGEDSIGDVVRGLRLAILQRVPLNHPFVWTDTATRAHFTEAAKQYRATRAAS